MIIESLLNMIVGLVKILLGWINLPGTPDKVKAALDYLLQCISDGIGFIGIVVDLQFLKIVIPLVLVISNFDKVYKFTMWIVKKIPFLGMQ